MKTLCPLGNLVTLAAALGLAAPAQCADRPASGPPAAMTRAGIRSAARPASTAPAVARSSWPAAPVPIVLLRRSARRAPDDSGADVLVRANLATDAIARRASRLLLDPDGYAQFVLRLDRRARSSLLHDPNLPAERRAALLEPAYLFLSDRQGGFPAEHFWLEEPDGTLREKRNVSFVDMVVREDDLEPGLIDGLEAIYAHELGHLVMASLAGPMPRKASNAVHFVTVRTDAWTAFNEGWGEHFQPMAQDHASQRAQGAASSAERRSASAMGRAGDQAATPSRRDAAAARERFWYERFAREEETGCWICPANLRFLKWQGPGEQRLRGDPLRDNRFSRQTALPAALRGDGRPVFAAQMYRDIVPPEPDGALKNGSQMLASEGVIATFFHRLASDPRLRARYREPMLYRPFLDEAEWTVAGSQGPASVVPPAENVYLKCFEVMRRGFTWGDWPALEFVKGYAASFPDEAGAVYDILLSVTRGVTVEADAASRHEDPGYLAGLRDRLLGGHARLDGHLGPPLWMTVPGLRLGMGAFRYVLLPVPHTFDLNAADTADLRSVGGVSAALADAIVAARDRQGWFGRVEDLAAVPGMTPNLARQFQAMHERMQARLARRRDRTSDPGWLKDYLAILVKSTYYLAALWQYGSGLLLAGLVFAVVERVLRRARPVAPDDGRVLPHPNRRWWRYGLSSLARGTLRAVLPAAASLALYAAGVLPGVLNMAAVGVAVGIVLASAAAARANARPATHAGSRRRAEMVSLVAASVAMSAVFGALY